MRYGREFWQQLVNEVEQGASVAEVARRHRVQPGTLSWWRWRLKTAARPRPLLLPILVRSARAEAAAPSTIELQLGELIIRVPTGTDVAYVAKLLGALRV